MRGSLGLRSKNNLNNSANESKNAGDQKIRFPKRRYPAVAAQIIPNRGRQQEDRDAHQDRTGLHWSPFLLLRDVHPLSSRCRRCIFRRNFDRFNVMRTVSQYEIGPPEQKQ